MDRPANIYSQIIYDLHSKIKELLDKLNNDGQIDHDEHGHPYVIAVEPVGSSTHRMDLIRCGRRENIIYNTRKRAEPIYSFKLDDGFKRLDTPRMATLVVSKGPRPERAKRPTMESYKHLVDQILGE